MFFSSTRVDIAKPTVHFEAITVWKYTTLQYERTLGYAIGHQSEEGASRMMMTSPV